jgi:hypothetical protein
MATENHHTAQNRKTAIETKTTRAASQAGGWNVDGMYGMNKPITAPARPRAVPIPGGDNGPPNFCSAFMTLALPP